MNKNNALKKNFFLNNLNLIIKLVFPIIIFPYVARVLEPETKGLIDFSLSIVVYFITVSSLGIPIYGIREVSRVKDEKNKLSNLTMELLYINIISTIICLFFYFIIIHLSEKLYLTRNIFYILSLNIIFTPLGIEWFYQGMEEYKYILYRNTFIQLISLSLIFLFVKNPDDYLKYCWINVFQTVGMNFFNIINLKKMIDFKSIKIRELKIKKHLNSIMITFMMRLASTIYVNLDTTMLGYLASEKSVAFYAAGVKFNKILVTVGTSLSAVMIPKINIYMKNGDREKIKELNRITLDFIFFYSVPAMICIYIFSPNIVNIFLGNQYLNTIKTMKIMSPIILFMGLSNFLGVQILYSNNLEKKMMFSLIIGALSNFLCNLFLIPIFFENGAALGTLIAEFGVLLTQYIFCKKYLNQKIINSSVIKYIYSGIISLFIVKIILMFIFKKNNLIETFICGTLFLICYLGMIYLMKEKNIMKFIKGVK